MLAHVHPADVPFTGESRPSLGVESPRRCGQALSTARPVPSAPWHTAGVTAGAVPSRRTSAGITPPASRLRAQASVRNPPSACGYPSVSRSLPVAARPGGASDLPGVSSANLAQRAWTPTPAARGVPLPVAAHPTTAFPTLGPGRRLASSRTATAVRSLFSGLQSFVPLQARQFARHPGCSYRRAFRRQAAMAFTSTPLSVRYLAEPWIG